VGEIRRLIADVQMTQKGAVEEALADWITKHKKDVTL